MNNVISLGMILHNHALAREKEEHTEHSDLEIREMLGKELGLDSEEAAELLRYMVERKPYLLPEEMQSESAATMYIRKNRIEIPEPRPTELLPDFAEPEPYRDLEDLLASLDRLEEEQGQNKPREREYNYVMSPCGRRRQSPFRGPASPFTGLFGRWTSVVWWIIDVATFVVIISYAL